jgi:hypothetical protein
MTANEPENLKRMNAVLDKFKARVNASALLTHLSANYCDPNNNGNPLARDTSQVGQGLTIIIKNGQKLYSIGHWNFEFILFFLDERAYNPAIWLSLQPYHYNTKIGDPIRLATFSEFTETRCIIEYYMPGDDETTKKDIDIPSLDIDVLSELAIRNIAIHLVTEPAVTGRFKKMLSKITGNTPGRQFRKTKTE